MKDRICLYTTPYPHVQSYYQIIDAAAELGLRKVEGFSNFELASPNRDAARKLRAYADEKGVAFSCLSVYADVSGENRCREIQRLKEYAHVAAILGSPYLHHTIVPEHTTPDHVFQNSEKLFQEGIVSVREIYDYAHELGVKTVYEDQGYIFNGVQGVRRFLREAQRDVGVVIDFGNIYQVDETIEDFIAAFSDRVVHVHLKDVAYTGGSDDHNGWLQTLHGHYFSPNRPGEGIIDFKTCIEMLEKSGYTGSYALEFNAGQGGAGAMTSYIEQVESWLNNAK